MAKINSKALDPQRYACIQAEQRELEQQYSTHITMARLCPYCKLRLETLCKGAHGATYLKCPQCGEAVFFPPVVFQEPLDILGRGNQAALFLRMQLRKRSLQCAFFISSPF